MHTIVPILLLIVGIVFIYAGVSTENIATWLGCMLTGFSCMFMAVAYMLERDDV
jgi:hypothetical protein